MKNGAIIYRMPFSARIVTSIAQGTGHSDAQVGQKNYVEAIEKHDVVFAIGQPECKTYLAVAMACSVKEEQVSRIILARPAWKP